MNNLHRIDPLRLEDGMKVAIVHQINRGRRVRLHRTKVKRELRVQYYEAGYWGNGGSWVALAPADRRWDPRNFDRDLATFPDFENRIGRSPDY